MKKIQDIIDTLSEEEKKQHSELIKESLERERHNEETRSKTINSVIKFMKIFENIIAEIKKNEENHYLNYLANLEDDKFYKE